MFLQYYALLKVGTYKYKVSIFYFFKLKEKFVLYTISSKLVYNCKDYSNMRNYQLK